MNKNHIHPQDNILSLTIQEVLDTARANLGSDVSIEGVAQTFNELIRLKVRSAREDFADFFTQDLPLDI